MKMLFNTILLLFTLMATAQDHLNLDFEYINPTTKLLRKWILHPETSNVRPDSNTKYHLHKSLKITTDSLSKYASAVVFVSLNFAKSKKLKLKGWVRINNKIKNGYAGLLIRTEKQYEVLKMHMTGDSITNGWKEILVEMKIDSLAESLMIGAFLDGQGTVWFDRLSVYIDGKQFNDIQPKTAELTKKEKEYLRRFIYTIKDADPYSNNDDLNFLTKLISKSEMVGLGECTHGTSEIFKMKHKIVRFLKERMSFNIFSVEANMPESYHLDKYVIEGQGNAKDLIINDLYLWPWTTYEFLNMVDWMRDSKKTSVKKMHFTGFDMQLYTGPINELLKNFSGCNNCTKRVIDIKTHLDKMNVAFLKGEPHWISDSVKLLITQKLDTLTTTVDNIFQKEDKISWIHQNITLIKQYINNTYYYSRDKFMADNLIWIKRNTPASKIVAWAHNEHVKSTAYSMGKYLKDSLQDNYLSIGFAFHKGHYTANSMEGIKSFQAQDSYPGTYEYEFQLLNKPIFLIDLREIKKSKSIYSLWLRQQQLLRIVGAAKIDVEFSETTVVNDFDFLIFINETTASTLLY